MSDEAQMFDVVAVKYVSNEILWVIGPRDERNAEAVISMAIARQGCEDRFFTTTAPGKYAQGDTYTNDSPL